MSYARAALAAFAFTTAALPAPGAATVAAQPRPEYRDDPPGAP